MIRFHRAAIIGRVTVLLLVVGGSMGVHAANYYFDPNGEDHNQGTSETEAWQSLSKLGGVSLGGGDSVLLKAGAGFNTAEGITIWQSGGQGNAESGSGASPIVVTTYPADGAAATITITAGNKNGVNVYNVGGVEVRNLVVEGPGALASGKSGISFYADVGGNTRLEHVVVDRCEVSGFKDGIMVGAQGSDNSSGFADIRITNCLAHDNRMAGISSWGKQSADGSVRSLSNIYVGYCEAYSNKGDPNYTSNHSGNGIVVSGVSGGTIEYCRAYNNGELNASTKRNGPVGIWVWEADEITIQYCISHDNNSGNNHDGGGFDIDGGAVACTLQYNYSYNNVGSGLLICQFQGATAFKDNVVRYNISENDGGASGLGGINFYSSGSSGGIQNTQVYNNTVYNGVSSVVRFMVTSGISGTTIRNNVFISANGRPLLRGNPSTSVALFQNNLYWNDGGSFSVAGHFSLEAWRSAKEQEQLDGSPVGIKADPRLEGAGNGEPLTDPANLYDLTAYTPRSGSPCIDRGLDLNKEFGVAMGTRDFYGTHIPRNQSFDIGACEYVHPTASSASRAGIRLLQVPHSFPGMFYTPTGRQLQPRGAPPCDAAWRVSRRGVGGYTGSRLAPRTRVAQDKRPIVETE